MIIVSVAFVICWAPNNVYALVFIVGVQTGDVAVGFNASAFLLYLYVCMNPFIYHQDVLRISRRCTDVFRRFQRS